MGKRSKQSQMLRTSWTDRQTGPSFFNVSDTKITFSEISSEPEKEEERSGKKKQKNEENTCYSISLTTRVRACVRVHMRFN